MGGDFIRRAGKGLHIDVAMKEEGVLAACQAGSTYFSLDRTPCVLTRCGAGTQAMAPVLFALSLMPPSSCNCSAAVRHSERMLPSHVQDVFLALPRLGFIKPSEQQVRRV